MYFVSHVFETAKMFRRLIRKHKTRVTFNLVIANEIHMHLIKGLVRCTSESWKQPQLTASLRVACMAQSAFPEAAKHLG